VAHQLHASAQIAHQNYATTHRSHHLVKAQPRYPVKNRNDTKPK